MRTAVIGCGGNGGIIAATLALNGRDPACITGRKESARIFREQGLIVHGEIGDLEVPVRAFRSLGETGDRFDIIFIAVKSGALERVFIEAKNYLNRGGIIATVSNGLEILEIAGMFPEQRVAAGAVGYNSVMLEYGVYRVNAKGGIVFGPLNSIDTQDLGVLKECFEPYIDIYITDNTEGMLWAKLIIVCGVTGLGGAAGLVTGELMKLHAARQLFYRIADEGAAVADAFGIRIEKLPGGINPVKFGNDGLPLFVRYLLLRVIGLRYRNLQANILIDLEKGKKTEIDFINGAVVRAGEKVGIPTPVNSAVVRLVHDIESGLKEMGVQNLYDIQRVSR
jgi:2-dehydropantoate 2-reductase